MSVYVLFWFDVEDYIEPQSDEALKGLLEVFESHGVQATWKLVGAKARVLEQRGRSDIIRLLQRQDIGYHTDNHSIHPVLAEYLDHMGWEDGIAELRRRETQGYRDLQRIVGPASTFGQAGGSWAPQLYPLLTEWEIPLFMDEAGHIGLDNGPFWYGSVLHINRMGPNFTRMDFRQGAAGLAQGQRDFDQIYSRLTDRGGLISIYYHPCEWATTDFWDGANFARGANPPPDQWQSPSLRSPQEMRAGLDLFAAYLSYVKTQPEVEIITGRQVLNLLVDRASEYRFTPIEIADLSAFADGEITYRTLHDFTLAPIELLTLTLDALIDISTTTSQSPTTQRPTNGYQAQTPFGPTRRIESTLEPGTSLCTQALLACCADVRDFIRCHDRLPDCAWLGVERLSPADFFLVASDLLAAHLTHGQFPDQIDVRRGRLALEEHVQANSWGWVIFPEDFDAPNLIELGRLQTWTLKPALLAG